VSTTCTTLSGNCGGTILQRTCTSGSGGTTDLATPVTAGTVYVDCAAAVPVAVTGFFRADTLVALKAIPSNTCNKVAWLSARVTYGDITFKNYLWFDGIVALEDLVTLSVITANDGLGQWVQQ